MNPGSSNSQGKSEMEVVREYLKQQYRPYSLNDLMLNLKTKLGKQKMVALLTELTTNGDIISKSIGKLVYYVYKERMSDELKSVDLLEIDSITLEINNLNAELKELKAKILEVTATISNTDLLQKTQALQTEIEKLQQSLTTAADSDTGDFTEASKKIKTMYTVRKRIFENIFSTIADSVEDPQAILKKAGIDMDEIALASKMSKNMP